MKFPLHLILLFLLLVSCTSELDRRLEATLSFAGANRAELEKVLHHYRDEPQKLEAARFLIAHMKGRHFYRSAGIDSIRHYLTVAAGQESCLPFDVEQKWGAYDYRQEAPVYDAQVLTADYLIENIEEAFEAWHYREWGQHYSFDDFCRYLLPYWIGDEAPDRWRHAFAKRFRPVLDSLYRGTDVVVELERPARIDHIVYVSRNDDNYVAPGETYELFYQNGVEGWKSLGMQTATDERLVYEDVPRGALLWLHNHTRGVEEQVFRWLDGEQVFCYRL